MPFDDPATHDINDASATHEINDNPLTHEINDNPLTHDINDDDSVARASPPTTGPQERRPPACRTPTPARSAVCTTSISASPATT